MDRREQLIRRRSHTATVESLRRNVTAPRRSDGSDSARNGVVPSSLGAEHPTRRKQGTGKSWLEAPTIAATAELVPREEITIIPSAGRAWRAGDGRVDV